MGVFFFPIRRCLALFLDRWREQSLKMNRTINYHRLFVAREIADIYKHDEIKLTRNSKADEYVLEY